MGAGEKENTRQAAPSSRNGGRQKTSCFLFSEKSASRLKSQAKQASNSQTAISIGPRRAPSPANSIKPNSANSRHAVMPAKAAAFLKT